MTKIDNDMAALKPQAESAALNPRGTHMQSTIRQIAAAAALLAIGIAQAASVVIPVGSNYGGIQLEGVGSLNFSADFLSALDTYKASVAGYGAAVPAITKDTDGYYTQVSVTAPITSLTIESTSGVVLAATTAGGATQTAPFLKSVSSGGSLTVTDLNVDFANKVVYATLIGGNGVGTLTNLALWNIGAITGTTSVTGPGTFFNATVSGLTITSNGFNEFAQSLGLQSLGKAALSGVTDFGTITIAPGIPEPSSYALMGLGLVSVVFAIKRRQAR